MNLSARHAQGHGQTPLAYSLCTTPSSSARAFRIHMFIARADLSSAAAVKDSYAEEKLPRLKHAILHRRRRWREQDCAELTAGLQLEFRENGQRSRQRKCRGTGTGGPNHGGEGGSGWGLLPFEPKKKRHPAPTPPSFTNSLCRLAPRLRAIIKPRDMRAQTWRQPPLLCICTL